MLVDHEFIVDYVAKIEELSRQLGSATYGDQRDHLLRRLRDLALRLDAIVELHLAKEERIYSRSSRSTSIRNGKAMCFERFTSPTGRRTTCLKTEHWTFATSFHGNATLIFDTFIGLKPSEAFVLINDHDPRPALLPIPGQAYGSVFVGLPRTGT
jgi:hypothetical protein